MSTMVSKQADLAGPGIGNYDELEKVLPHDYNSLLSPKDTQQAIAIVKRYIEENLCRQLNLMRVEVPLIVDVESGVNDYLDRDGSRTPIEFHISNDHDKHPIDAQVVQAATKWKRVALKQFDMQPGEGLITDMHAVRKDYFLVNAETLKQQLEITGQGEFLELPYHKAVINHEVPLSIGGGIGQSRTVMLLLRKAHLGEVSVTVWPKKLKELCRQKNIQVLE